MARARALGAGTHEGPILLIDHCDNCGSGGTQDVMRVVEEILKQNLDDVAIAPIRDPQAVAQMVEAGIGNSVNLKLGGKTDMPAIGLAGRPLKLSGRVRNITDGEIVFTGPMYTGLKSHLGRTAVLDTGRAQIVVTERHHEPFDLVIFRHCGIEPTKKKFIMLKSRIHYRAGFKPIASHIVECAGAGVTNADLSNKYRKLARLIYPPILFRPNGTSCVPNVFGRAQVILRLFFPPARRGSQRRSHEPDDRSLPARGESARVRGKMRAMIQKGLSKRHPI